ncbi:DUF72 domain-containing protein [Gloeobacter morelensis]|uniref:DUF72 domain-containing protein n=1 Tax=Gloeobacter morelensis MG652769 TaxID=2781736 RepID=A0ABY3PGN0_9CYAN|nr:DUF72 domain-containing protein [Gloeobacter morelensis]UFP92815.1 DUF72 domain-containing protein [Gloeobacter morelensis MG652769]
MALMSEDTLIYVGCQGWRYPDWRLASAEAVGDLRAPFYPPRLPAARELEHYARTFGLVEVDSTFYAVPQVRVVKNWAAQVPETFRFTLKLPRTLTHDYRLARGRATLSAFCECARPLGVQLAAILIQLPPSFATDEFAVLERFLPHLPADLPFAVEFRDPAWLSERTVELLAAHRIALTLGDTPWIPTPLALAWIDRLPTDWLYLRLMGSKSNGLEHFTHRQFDRTETLDAWAAAVGRLAQGGKRVYVLLDNHFEGFSPGSAMLLVRKLGLAERPFPRDCPAESEQLGLEW